MSNLELLSTLAPVVMIAAWAFPYEAIAFLVIGSIPYYAVLHVAGIDTSGELTGMVFGATGAAATARLLTIKGRAIAVLSSPYVILYALFVGIWYLRWYLEPPRSATLEIMATFGGRAQVFMVVFSAMPFIGGMALRTREELMRTLRALAAIGGLASAIILAYWVSGAPNLGPEWSLKWEPIRTLSGIIVSFDLGLGLLAYLLMTDRFRHRFWVMLRWLPVVLVVAEVVRVGQRGPFIFLIVALLAYLGLDTKRAAVRAVVSMAAAVAIISFVALEIGDSYNATRTIAMQNYTSEENGDRLELIGMAASFIAERPLEGWGGSLLGRPAGPGGGWTYSHIMLLDPLVETGLIGAIPFWSIYVLALSRFGRLWRSARDDLALKAIGIVLLYTLLESQVYGHVSSTKHAWLATGMLCGITEWMRPSAHASVSSNREPSPQDVNTTSRVWQKY